MMPLGMLGEIQRNPNVVLKLRTVKFVGSFGAAIVHKRILLGVGITVTITNMHEANFLCPICYEPYVLHSYKPACKDTKLKGVRRGPQIDELRYITSAHTDITTWEKGRVETDTEVVEEKVSIVSFKLGMIREKERTEIEYPTRYVRLGRSGHETSALLDVILTTSPSLPASCGTENNVHYKT